MTKSNDILANTTKQERILIAIRGENIEQLLKLDEPNVIVELITNGYVKEYCDQWESYYDRWKTHPHGNVRYTLARLGLYPETFITDKNVQVRNAVVRKHPEYIEQLLERNNKRHWQHVCTLINTNTDLQTIKTFLDAKVPKAVDKSKLRAIRTFYTLRTQTPTMVEKTMTPVQLFKIESPFWAIGLTISRIEEIQTLHKCTELDAFYSHFDELLNDETYSTASWNLKENHRKEKR
jgi:hypothetical protein